MEPLALLAPNGSLPCVVQLEGDGRALWPSHPVAYGLCSCLTAVSCLTH